MTKVAIQGARHSFHYIVSKNMLPSIDEYVYCNTFEAVFKAVDENNADYGVVATRNSAYGTIEEVSELRKQFQGLNTKQEATLRVELHLLSIREAVLEDITAVYSQAPALAASKAFLDGLGVATHEYYDTAAAAKYVAKSGSTTKAAIASESAANEFNLKILRRNIETVENYTDFVLITK